MMGVVSHVPYLDSGSQNGILSALPYVSAYICIVLGGLLADYLFSRKILRLNTIRKLFTVIGVVIPSAFTVSLFWVRSSFGATIAFLILAFSFKSIVQSGALINFMDIAPRHGTLLRGLSQIFSYLSGTISPTVSGFLISQDSEFGWRNVFLLSFAVGMAGLFFYLIFGQAEVQDWAKGRPSPTSEQTE